jgi:hypothetical protein
LAADVRRWRTLLWFGVAWLAAVGAAQAQPAPGPPPPLRIFLDCYECDTEYLRQNVRFIDYMRDRTDADLHVLVTTQSTGGGGRAWTIRMLGLGRFAGLDRTHTFTTSSTATSDDQRREFARVFRLGLASYATDTAVARDLDVTFTPPKIAAAAPPRDRWRRWVFRTSASGSASGEQASASRSYSLSFSGNRITEAWKLTASTSGRVSESRFTLSDGRIIRSRSDSWSAGGTLVKSLGPRLSSGIRLGAGHSSFSNEDRYANIYPGIEFNFFPYSEYQRRRLTIWYEVGPNYYTYRELTIFDKLQERVTKQQMDVSLSYRQPWGSLGIFGSISHHLAHRDRYRASVFGHTDVRLFKGFSFNVFADYARIRDRIALPKAGATQEEILLRLRQLATGYSYSMSVGFSYSFGSIFNSVVNPRFGNY